MKLFTAWILAAGLVLASAAANAQVAAPGRPGPRLLPPQEVYTVVRGSGFSALGIPKQHGFVYTIAVVDRRGADGRLVIDARNGQIIRFMPGSRTGSRFGDAIAYGPPGPLPFGDARPAPRPPRNVPKVASHTPSAAPPHAGEAPPIVAAPAPAPAQQTAAGPAKPAEPHTTGQGAAPAQAAAPATVEAKPAPQIAPTQDMPKVQGLE
jgi:hypothetical protein